MSKKPLKVVKGDRVVVVRSYNRPTVDKATVVKVGRVWVEVEPDGWGRTEKYRMDDRTDGSGFSQRGMIYTPEEWAKKKAASEARQRIYAHGLRLEFSSPWTERLVELADMLDNATPQEGK